MRVVADAAMGLLLASVLLHAAVAGGQGAPGQGAARAQGVVRGPEGEPIVEGRVTLRLEADPAVGPPPVATDARGRWAILGLAGGRWRVVIEAEGFLTAEGALSLREDAPNPPLEVALRTLDEVSPTDAERNPATVLRWIEKGNILLEQERAAAARSEYEKALPFLDPQGRAELLRAVARTYYLEGRFDEAMAALESTLEVAPGDETTHRLLAVLREEAAAGAEEGAEEKGASGKAAGSREPATGETAAAPRTPQSPPPYQLAPFVAPEPGRLGAYRTRFSERSPLGAIEAFAERFGVGLEEIAAEDPRRGGYDLAAESFEVFVPESYRADGSFGLLVWISPGPYGGARRPEVLALLAERRLIWAGADDSGNDRLRWDRTTLALDAAHNLARLYRLDPERIYAAGYSGGGRVASGLAMLYPEVFRGGFFFFGVDFHRSLPIPDRPGSHWPARFAPPPRARLKEVKGATRFVLLTGERDFNRVQTRRTYEAMREEGFQCVTMLEVPGASHYDPVPADWIARGLEALDAPCGAD